MFLMDAREGVIVVVKIADMVEVATVESITRN